MNGAKKGFSLVEIMTAVGVIGALAAIALPNFVSYRKNSQAKVCLGNLKQIQAAVELCKLAGREASDANIFGAENYIKIKPKCPLDYTKEYIITPNSDGSVKIECPNNPGGDYAHVLPEDRTDDN